MRLQYIAFDPMTSRLQLATVQVRKSTAQQLYLKLLGEDLPGADKVADILLSTVWDDSKEKAEAAQQVIERVLLPDREVEVC